MKKILFGFVLIAIGIAGCKKYDDSYLNSKLPKTMAYFASFQEYTRTVVVGEGLSFKIGAAMAGLTTNTLDRTIDLQIDPILYKTTPTDPRLLMPGNYYTTSPSGKPLREVIPAGQFIGYITVNLDSVNFLSDPTSMYKSLNNEGYTLPVRIVATSLDSIEQGLDTIKISVKYIAGQDGYYLFKQTIKKEVAGSIVTSVTKQIDYPNESDNSTHRFLTQGPYKLKVTAATVAFTAGLNFNINVDKSSAITYESITGQPVVTAEGTNTYNPKTRDFALNYNYKKAGIVDTTYHVTDSLFFRNRIRDKVNETRDYLRSLNP
jgi:hypothetical protein